ncbi:MAG: hypothetical protein AB7O97_10445 [Planctomycetota bacterium]
MSRLLLVHWHEAEAAARRARLAALGHEVAVHWDQALGTGAPELKALAAEPVDAVVLDLGRLPSHGNGIATWLRERLATRRVPLVFVPGDPAKTERLRARFPDAVFAPWARIGPALKRAITAPPRAPVVPQAPDYSGTPLPKKLGIRSGARVALVRAPAGFADALGALPDGARCGTRLTGELDVVVLFCRALVELQRDFAAAARCLADRGGLWVAWPKKASGVQTDLGDAIVRATGLDHGLVDNKVCAIDATWSGLRFARRQQDRAPAAAASAKRPVRPTNRR